MIKFADVSEFQATLNARAYRDAGNEVIIARVSSGYRTDKAMPARMEAIRAVAFTAVGWYIFLVPDRDPAQQVREAIAVIGRLRPNEFPIVDHEKGSGNQIARCAQACAEFDKWAGFPCTLYAGEAFMRNQLGGAARWKRPRWIANYLNSYQPTMSSYPAGATFWQYSDRDHFTGLIGAVDASVYPGTAKQLLADVRPAPGPVVPVASLIGDTLATVVKADGRIETFEEKPSGEVVHKWQTAKDSGWVTSWQSLGKPG